MASRAIDARDEVLRGIRSALGEMPDVASIAAEYVAIPRAYKRFGTLSQDLLLELFARRLKEYDAGVHRVTNEGLQAEISRVLSVRNCQRIIIADGLESRWLPAGFEFLPGAHLDNYELDAMDGVLTACTVAIAETGSIVLQNAAGQGPRILSLIPDYHLCVVFAEQVVETVPEAFAKLEATRSLPTTFFSGPSATADIEMTRIKGVHGPRFLDVLLVE